MGSIRVETGELLSAGCRTAVLNHTVIAYMGIMVYVSCMGDVCDTVNKFSLTEMCRVKRIGGRGSDTTIHLSLSTHN